MSRSIQSSASGSKAFSEAGAPLVPEVIFLSPLDLLILNDLPEWIPSIASQADQGFLFFREDGGLNSKITCGRVKYALS